MRINFKQLNYRIGVQDVGQKIKVYNGKKWIILRCLETMVMHFIGEFVQTKRQGGGIHKLKIKKKTKSKK